MIEHLRSYCFKKPNNFYWFFLRIRMYQPIENKILLQVYLIVIIHVQDHTGYLYELIEPSYLFSLCTKNKIRNKSNDWIHFDKKYQNTSHFFFYKRWWRDMHIVHVFVWNLMIGHVFFSTNLTLPGNLLHPYYCHCRKPQQGNYRQLKKKQQIHMY